MMHKVGKELLCYVLKVQIQICMHICAVISGHSLFVDIYLFLHILCSLTYIAVSIVCVSG